MYIMLCVSNIEVSSSSATEFDPGPVPYFRGD